MAGILLALVLAGPAAEAEEPLSTADVMGALQASDWRQPDPANLLYMRLTSGTVIMELAPFSLGMAVHVPLVVSGQWTDW